MPNKPAARHIIGCNIRPGMTPGGFTKTCVEKPDGAPIRKRGRPATVKQAAIDALARRGIVNQPTVFDQTAAPNQPTEPTLL